MSTGFKAVTVLVLFLCGVIYATAAGNADRDAQYQAALRLIGEAVDDGDIVSLRDAIRKYNSDERSPSAIIEALADRQRP
tara:strand:- start:140 stop:379 length:240 start_codon:yes stop_codon:yes gene_type:complete